MISKPRTKKNTSTRSARTPARAGRPTYGKLTDKQRAFCQEYLIDLNATQAAIRAGYSQKTAYSIANELLKKPEIQAEIQNGQALRQARTEITADRVIAELAAIGFANTTHAVTIVKGRAKFKDTDALTEETRRAISEIKQTTSLNGGSLSVKFHDKKGALELLGRHLGIFNDPEAVDIPAPTSVVINVVDGRKPA